MGREGDHRLTGTYPPCARQLAAAMRRRRFYTVASRDTKETLMELKLDNEALMELAAKKIADAAMYEDNSIMEMARKEITTRIDKIFVERAEAAVSAAIDNAVSDALDREYRRINQFGEPKGEATTIRAELAKLAEGYWSTRVKAKSGAVSDDTYGTITRAEYVMVQACGDKFADQMKQAGVSMAAALKDGLRGQMAERVDKLLDELFRVKSLQDQGKAVKPW